MTAWGWDFEYVPSHRPMTRDTLSPPRSLMILSDYPAALFDGELQQLAVQKISQGCGFVMIGGWESFHGFGGNWDGTPLGSVLPVAIQTSDDRMNFDQSSWLSPRGEHPITAGLPWTARPPAIGGMNQVVAKPAAEILLEAQSFAISEGLNAAGVREWSFCPEKSYPALVVGAHGQGRTAAFMTDVAPHWVGGFVDWGLPRVTGQAVNGPAIEVGCHYATFWKQLLQWTGGILR